MNIQTKDSLTPDMTIESILNKFPSKSQRIAQELTNAGLHCVGCGAAVWETLEAGMQGHGKSATDLERLMTKLNAIIDEEENPQTITITERAAKKYLQVLESEDKLGWAIRFSEKKGGCGGFEYILDYSEKPQENDAIFSTSQGIDIHLEQKDVDRLLGSVIDYIDGLQGSGFKISNPNVTGSCHCGSSHNYKKKK